MGRKPAPQPLALPSAAGGPDQDQPQPQPQPQQQQQQEQEQEQQQQQRSGETLPLRSPRSPHSPFRLPPKKSPAGSERQLHVAELVQQQPLDASQYPPITSAIHPTPTAAAAAAAAADKLPRAKHGHRRREDEKASKSGFFFNFTKSSKSSDRLHAHQYSDSAIEPMPSDAEFLSMTKQSSGQSGDPSHADHAAQKSITSIPSKSDLSLASAAEFDTNGSQNTTKKGGKAKTFTLLGRNKSLRDDKDGPVPRGPPVTVTEPQRAQTSAGPLKTAPVPNDRAFRDMMSSGPRNHSADPPQPREPAGGRGLQRDREHSRTQPSSLKENGGGSSFFSGFRNSRAADMISKGLFGKGARSGSTTDKEPTVDDEHYVLKVINLPLVEQTRLTRISKRLEDSRDKTEFWMPAFPWRAIDYLNYNGCDVEGLYRVPGSGPQIKKWQRKFDEQYDVDLFAQDDLYDINIIGSMLKAWLRELPDELFPKEAQERIARECAGSEKVPQMLIDELSNLSPFSYYLLFAITCHLSLLLAHSKKNKMDFRNLCICFQPCMKIDAFCFKFLVCDWRDCWKGCKNEARYIEEEYSLIGQPPPRALPGRQQGEEAVDDRNVSSSDSNQLSHQGEKQKGRLKRKGPQAENESIVSADDTISTTLTTNSERGPTTPPRRSGDLRPLSPIKPLSPLGF